MADAEYWRTSYEAKAKEFNDLVSDFKSFQKSSREFENELELELQTTNEDLEKMRADLHKTEAQLRHVREESERYKRVTGEEIASLQAMLQQNGQDGGNVSEQRVLRAQQAREAAERKLSDVQQELQEKVDTQAEQIEILQMEIEDLVAEHHEEVTALKREVRMAKAVAGSRPVSTDLSYVLDADAGGAGGASSGVAVVPPDIQELLDTQVEEIKELNVALRTLTEEKVELENRLLEETELNEELTKEVSELTDDFMSYSDRIEELEDELLAVKAAAAKQNDAVLSSNNISIVASLPVVEDDDVPGSPTHSPSATSLLHNIPEHRETLEMSAELRKTQDELLDAQEAQERLRQEKERLEAQLELASEQNERLQAEVSSLTVEHHAAGEQLATLEAVNRKLEDAKLSRQAAEAKCLQLEEEMFETNTSLSEAQVRIEELERKLASAEGTLSEQANVGIDNVMRLQAERDELESRLVDAEARAYEAQTAMKNLQARLGDFEMERRQSRVRAMSVREVAAQEAAAAAARLAETIPESGNAAGAQVRLRMAELRASSEALSAEVVSASADMSDFFDQLRVKTRELDSVLASTRENYRKEVSERRKLFDSLQQERGNIRVYCRVRPLLPDEVEDGIESVLEFPGHNQVAMIRPGSSGPGSPSGGAGADGAAADVQKMFTFDRVFGPQSSQVEVFRDVESLISSTMDGYNVCVFAYGQTGSGKTYTMLGDDSARGISYRALNTLFTRARQLAPQFSYKVSVSYIEIYNENLRDLLNNDTCNVVDDQQNLKSSRKSGTEKLEIRKGSRGHYVKGAVKQRVHSAQEVMDVLTEGAKNRATGVTNANEHSSRSHSILVVYTDGVDQVTKRKTHGKLHLVDLAGSERVKHTASTGQRFVEATYINKSLSALGDVMHALSHDTASSGKKVHIPYRNSKLTYLLQDSLGGNSRTLMFVNASPADFAAQETMQSLQFARRVRKIQLTATASVENAALQKYKDKLADAKQSIQVLEARVEREKSKAADTTKKSEEESYEMREQIKMLEARLRRADMDKRKAEKEIEAERARLKRGSSGDARRTDAALQRKILSLEDKVEHLSKLLKLSQREAKKLRADAKARQSEVRESKSKKSSKTRSLEDKMSKLAETARKEAVMRKRAEQASESNKRELAKQVADKDHLIKILRKKNRTLQDSIMSLKKEAKKKELVPMYTKGAKMRRKSKSKSKKRSSSRRRGDSPVKLGKSRRSSKRKTRKPSSDSQGSASPTPSALSRSRSASDVVDPDMGPDAMNGVDLARRLFLSQQAAWHEELADSGSSHLPMPRRYSYLDTFRELREAVGAQGHSAPGRARSASIRYRATSRAVLHRRSQSRTSLDEHTIRRQVELNRHNHDAYEFSQTTSADEEEDSTY